MRIVSLAMLLLVGCGTPAPVVEEPVGESAPDRPVVGGFTLAFQSRLEAELEPCGCPKAPMGGLPRRGAALSNLRGQYEHVLVVDGGVSMIKQAITPEQRAQRMGKADLVAQAFKDGQIDAMALSRYEWSLGFDFVDDLVATHELPVLAANLVCEGNRPYPGHKVFELGGMKVAVVGLTEGPVDRCEVEPIVLAATRETERLPDVDLVIGLVPVMGGDLEGLREQGLPFDVVIDASGAHQPDRVGEPDQVWQLFSGERGKRVGVANFELFEGGTGWAPVDYDDRIAADLDSAQQRMTTARSRLRSAEAPDAITRARVKLDQATAEREVYLAQQARSAMSLAGRSRFSVELVELTDDVADHPRVKQLVDDFKAGSTALAYTGFTHDAPDDGPWLGAAGCKSCHLEQHMQWKRTRHADAWQTLVNDQRNGDYDCFSCHAMGVRQFGGPTSPDNIYGFHDVQCEACHGPARAHASDPLEVKPIRRPDVETCRGCHDGERDGGRFDQDTYWPQIVH